MTDFTNKRAITSADQLTPHQAEQLRACGYAYYRQNLSPAELLAPEETGDEPVLRFCELWDVVVDGEVAYEAWFYQVDSGTIFKAGTTETVAEIIQFGLECGDEELEPHLGAGMVKAGLLPPQDSEYERYKRFLDEQA